MKLQINSLAIFLLVLGCVSSINRIVVVSMALFGIDYILNRDEYKIKELFSQEIIGKSIKILCLALLLFSSASIAKWNIAGIKEAGHYIERALPYFVFMFLCYRRKNILTPITLGACIGVIIVTVTVMMEYLFDEAARPSGILGNPNKSGGWVILALPLIFACLSSLKNKVYEKTIGYISLISTIIVLVLSGSRGAILGVLAMTLVGVVVYYKIEFKKIIVVTGLLICALIGLYQFDIIGFQRSYDNERLLLWGSGIRMFMDYPLFGVGWNNWGEIYRASYISPFAREPHLGTPHNIILHYLGMVGIVGTSGILLIFVSQIYCLIKSLYPDNTRNLFLLGMLLSIVGTIVHGMVDVVFNNKSYMVLYGMLWGVVCIELLKTRSLKSGIESINKIKVRR